MSLLLISIPSPGVFKFYFLGSTLIYLPFSYLKIYWHSFYVKLNVNFFNIELIFRSFINVSDRVDINYFAKNKIRNNLPH